MKIRSITYFLNPGHPVNTATFEKAAAFIASARPAFVRQGYQVQTTRLATPPFANWLPSLETGLVVEAACQLESLAHVHGADYISLGPALPHVLQSYTVVPDVFAATRNVFLSGLLTSQEREVILPAVRACAQVIHRASALTQDGFANLRFAALANVQPGAPFFPAAYHQGDQPAFALATEAADLAVEAFTGASSLANARQGLISQVESHAGRLVQVAEGLVDQFGVVFKGLDFTLAPFPEEARSIGTALERLGVPAFGMHGSLAASAFLTDTLDQARYPRIGFNGLFLTVLEDATLAKRAAEGLLSLNELLLYSSVCGTGLDTVPLPGNTSVDELAAILLDLAAMALRLNKPLTARLMPIPGKSAGDPTEFDFPYFANSRVLPVRARGLSGLLGGEDSFQLDTHKG